MATAKKASKKQLVTKSKPAAKKTIAKKTAPKKKVVAKKNVKAVKKTKSAKAKPLTREERIQNLYPPTMSKADKLNSVLEHCEVVIHDIIRNTLQEAFNTDRNEFDQLIRWLDSRLGKAFLEESNLISARMVEDILERAVNQFEVDNWNEDNASLNKTACYVFDSSFTLFEANWYEPALAPPNNF